jgi:hypothetical protein
MSDAYKALGYPLDQHFEIYILVVRNIYLLKAF